MSSTFQSRSALRVALMVSAVLFVIGGLLLSIVGDPPRTPYGLVTGVGLLGVGCVFILAGAEACWRQNPTRVTLHDALRALVFAALLLVGAGLLVQLLYTDQRAFTFLVSGAVPLVAALATTYLIARVVLVRLGTRG